MIIAEVRRSSLKLTSDLGEAGFTAQALTKRLGAPGWARYRNKFQLTPYEGTLELHQVRIDIYSSSQPPQAMDKPICHFFGRREPHQAPHFD